MRFMTVTIRIIVARRPANERFEFAFADSDEKQRRFRRASFRTSQRAASTPIVETQVCTRSEKFSSANNISVRPLFDRSIFFSR